MEIVVTRSNENTDELQHHGTKGMKWGQRLYQNKDGSLTPLGKKRYNKEVEKLKAEEAKVKAAEKAAKTKAKNQAKFDKLDEKKADLEARKKALKGKSDKDVDDKPDETLDQKRERLLKSTDPKEIYKDRDALTYQELNDRVNRIDLENRLMSKIPVEHEKSATEWMNDTRTKIDAASNLYKSVDNAVSSVANSYIGKTLAKTMGLELPKEEKTRESLSDFLKNIDKKSDKEIQDRQQVESNIKKLKEEEAYRKKQAEKAKKSEEAQKQANDSQDNNTNNTNKQDKTNESDNTKQAEPKNNKHDNQNKQSEKQSEPEIKDAPKTEKKSSDNSNKKKGEDISDYVDWKDVSDENSPVRKSVNEVVQKSGSVKLSNADYKQYEKDIKAWREKYDSEDSPYSQKQMLDALYEIEKEYGISWRKL